LLLLQLELGRGAGEEVAFNALFDFGSLWAFEAFYTLLFFYLKVLTVKHVCESSLLLTGLRFRCYSLAVRQRGVA
jgi:hypothetical protein